MVETLSWTPTTGRFARTNNSYSLSDAVIRSVQDVPGILTFPCDSVLPRHPPSEACRAPAIPPFPSAVVIGYLIAHVGPTVIWHTIRRLSWGLLLVLVFPACLAVAADTVGWRFTFPKLPRLPRSFGRLGSVRIAGKSSTWSPPTRWEETC